MARGNAGADHDGGGRGQAERAGAGDNQWGAVRTLMRMPWLASTPVPTMTAVGVARPSAQGQAITSGGQCAP